MTPEQARIEAHRILAREAEIYCDNGAGEWTDEESELVYPAVRELGRVLDEMSRTLERRATLTPPTKD